MMFYTDLPEAFGCLVVLQLEPDGGLEVLELPGPDLDVETVPLVRDLDDLGPRKPAQKIVYSEVNKRKTSMNKSCTMYPFSEPKTENYY